MKVDLQIGENHYELTLGVCLVLPLIGKSCPIEEGPGEFNVATTIPATSPVSVKKIVVSYGLAYCTASACLVTSDCDPSDH